MHRAQEDPEYILKFQSDDVKRVMGSLNTSAATEAFESGGGGAKAQASGSLLLSTCALGARSRRLSSCVSKSCRVADLAWRRSQRVVPPHRHSGCLLRRRRACPAHAQDQQPTAARQSRRRRQTARTRGCALPSDSMRRCADVHNVAAYFTDC